MKIESELLNQKPPPEFVHIYSCVGAHPVGYTLPCNPRIDRPLGFTNDPEQPIQIFRNES